MKMNDTDKKRLYHFVLNYSRNGWNSGDVPVSSDGYNEEHARRRILNSLHDGKFVVKKLQLLKVDNCDVL